MTNLTSSIQVSEALDAIRMGMEFAYKQGLHEFGSDPVETVETALAMRSKDHSIAVDDVREAYREGWFVNAIPADDPATSPEYLAACEEVDWQQSKARAAITAIGSQSIEPDIAGRPIPERAWYEGDGGWLDGRLGQASDLIQRAINDRDDEAEPAFASLLVAAQGMINDAEKAAAASGQIRPNITSQCEPRSQSIEGERLPPEAELYAKYLEEAPGMPFHTWATQPKCDCGQSSNGSQGAHHPQCPGGDA